MTENTPIEQTVSLEDGNLVIEKRYDDSLVEQSPDGKLYWHVLYTLVKHQDEASGKENIYMMVQTIGESPYPTIADVPEEIMREHMLDDWTVCGSFDHEPSREEVDQVLPKM